MCARNANQSYLESLPGQANRSIREMKEANMASATNARYEALAQQSHALRVIFEGLPWGVIVADQAGNFLFSNPAAEKIIGFSSVEAFRNNGAFP